MAGKLNSLSVERAHRSGVRVLLGDGDGLYLRKQTCDGASWTLRYRFGGRDRWLTLHDLRRTARTHLAALGVRREVAERCLGHKLKGC